MPKTDNPKTDGSKTNPSGTTSGKADTDSGFNFEQAMRSFDPAQLMKQFDPATFADTCMQMAAKYEIPLTAIDAFLNSQKKNIAALTVANQEMMAGMKSVTEHQERVLSEMLDKTASSYNEIIKSGDPKETATHQLDLIKKSYEKLLEDVEKMTAITTQTQEKIAHALAYRVSEGLEEIRESTKKS